MKKISAYRVVAASSCGVLFAWLWLWASSKWAIYVELSFLFPALRRITEITSPWMTGVGSVLFAIISATFTTLIVAVPLKPLWWAATAMFLVAFCVAQAVIGIYVGTPIAYLATYGPLWLFMAWFALCSYVLSRLGKGIGSNQAFKPTGHKKPWPAA